MSKQVLKAFNSHKKIILSVFSGILIALSGCGDLVEETDTETCNKAIDERDYETATSACTSRKDKATAWMGRAGYDIVNLIKASSSAPSAHTKPSSLGKDDPSGAVILNILQLSTDVYSDDTERAEKIKNSKEYLDKASEELHKYISDNSSPLSVDELLLNTYALAFAVQLDQTIMYDNATTSKTTFPTGNNENSLVCEKVDGDNSTEASAVLVKMDGHLWEAERNGMQCNRVLNAIKGLDSDSKKADAISKLATWVAAGGGTVAPLPDEIYKIVCPDLVSLTRYTTKLADTIATIGDKLILSEGSNTKMITDSKNSTDNLTKTIGCYKAE